MLKSDKRHYSYLVLIVVVCLAALGSARQGVASAWHFKSLFYIEKLEQGQTLSEQAYQEALQAAQKAQGLIPQNPHYNIVLARILEWGSFLHFTPLNVAELELLYETAIQQRPSWPDAYAAYASVLAYLAQQPERAALQLLLAEQHGPYMPEVLVQSVRIGSDFWQYMPAEFKGRYFVLATRLAKSHGQAFRQMANHLQQHPMRDLTCAYLRTQSLTPEQYQRTRRALCRSWPLPA